MIKTFRGLLGDNAQDRIRLSTIKGKVGYRIIKFEVIGGNPTSHTQESVCMIWTTEQTAPYSYTPDFSDSDFLGVGLWMATDATSYPATTKVVIFDRVLFNQDIYVTHQDIADTGTLNYYIELEVITLNDASAEYTTIKDIRTQKQ